MTGSGNLSFPSYRRNRFRRLTVPLLVRRGGFEPPNHLGSVLQTACFDRACIPTHNVEPHTGIEPVVSAWKAEVLPLH